MGIKHGMAKVVIPAILHPWQMQLKKYHSPVGRVDVLNMFIFLCLFIISWCAVSSAIGALGGHTSHIEERKFKN